MDTSLSFAKVQVKGIISRELKATEGGLCVMSIGVAQGSKHQNWVSYIPIYWFKEKAFSVAKEYADGDEVIVDADVRMRRRKEFKCPRCGQEISGKFYDPQLVGQRVKKVDLTADVQGYEDIDFGG